MCPTWFNQVLINPFYRGRPKCGLLSKVAYSEGSKDYILVQQHLCSQPSTAQETRRHPSRSLGPSCEATVIVTGDGPHEH